MAVIINCIQTKISRLLSSIPVQCFRDSPFTDHRKVPMCVVLDKCITPRYLGTSNSFLSKKKFIKPQKPPEVQNIDGTITRRKTEEIPKVTLLHVNGDKTIETLHDAERFAKSRSLQLIKVMDSDPNSGRPMYQLKSMRDIMGISKEEEKEKSKSNSKGKKLLMINTTAQNNDIQSKLKNAQKWVEKMYRPSIHIHVISENWERADEIYEIFQESFKKSGKVSPKVVKTSTITFFVDKLKTNSEKDSTSEKKEVKKLDKKKAMEEIRGLDDESDEEDDSINEKSNKMKSA